MAPITTPQTQTGIDDALIAEIVRRVLTVAKPEKIILFGSAATGGMTRDSDIDLLIVESESVDEREQYVRIRRALRHMGYPFDILFISAHSFEAGKNIIGGIAYPANKHGRAIYATTSQHRRKRDNNPPYCGAGVSPAVNCCAGGTPRGARKRSRAPQVAAKPRCEAA